jgi:uncharacterized caspase-like protein
MRGLRRVISEKGFRTRRAALVLRSKNITERDADMDRSIARLNVEHFRRLLAKETDETRRQTLQRLLAEEEAKLAEPGPKERKRKQG